MPKIAYLAKQVSDEKLYMIDRANRVINSFKAQGYDLTLRQLYYQFVAKDLFPSDRKYVKAGSKWKRDADNGTNNAEPNYKWLGDILNTGRMIGLVDWNAIVDRTRNVNRPSHWETPGDIIETAASGYKIDLWEGQEYRPEVWVEKEALAGVVSNACSDYDLAYFSCRGYVSQSAQWRAAQRLISYVKNGQIPVIIHLGDHDPSGIDMTRDISDRIRLFMEEAGHDPALIKRIALNMDQIEQYNPPPNPAKITDSRAGSYINKYGDESWELDALDPNVMIRLVHDRVERYLDNDLFEERKAKQEEERNMLREIADRYDLICDAIKDEAL